MMIRRAFVDSAFRISNHLAFAHGQCFDDVVWISAENRSALISSSTSLRMAFFCRIPNLFFSLFSRMFCVTDRVGSGRTPGNARDAQLAGILSGFDVNRLAVEYNLAAILRIDARQNLDQRGIFRRHSRPAARGPRALRTLKSTSFNARTWENTLDDSLHFDDVLSFHSFYHRHFTLHSAASARCARS